MSLNVEGGVGVSAAAGEGAGFDVGVGVASFSQAPIKKVKASNTAMKATILILSS